MLITREEPKLTFDTLQKNISQPTGDCAIDVILPKH